MKILKPELDIVKKKLDRAKAEGNDKETQNQMVNMRKIFEKHETTPFSIAWGFVQLPFQIGGFLGVKAMCDAKVPGLAAGGVGIWPDLTALDPTWTLPLLSSLAMLLSAEVNSRFGGASDNPTVMNIFRFFAYES